MMAKRVRRRSSSDSCPFNNARAKLAFERIFTQAHLLGCGMWRRAATSLPVALARYYETIRGQYESLLTLYLKCLETRPSSAAGKLTVGSVLVKDDKLWKVSCLESCTL